LTRISIVSLYEKSKGLFWWKTQEEGSAYLLSTSKKLDWFLQHWFIHVLDEKIVVFSPPTPFNSMLYYESIQHFNLFKEGYQSIFSALEKNIWQSSQGKRLWLRFPNLKEPEGFFYPSRKHRIRCIDNDLYIKLKNIKREDNYWKIEIEGANGQKVMQIVDNNYEVIEVVGEAIKNKRAIPKPMSLKDFVE
jgi:hypothetical protein